MPDRYNTPEKGTTDWHQPLNDNFEDLDDDVEIRDEEANLSNYEPAAGRKFLATDTGTVYDGDGSQWNKASRRLQSVHTESVSIGGTAVDLPVEVIERQNYSDTTQAVNFDVDISGYSLVTVIGRLVRSGDSAWDLDAQVNNYGDGAGEDSYEYTIYDSSGFTSRTGQTEWKFVEGYDSFNTAEFKYELAGGAQSTQTRPSVFGNGGGPNRGAFMLGGHQGGSDAGVPDSIQLSSSQDLDGGEIIILGGTV